MRNIRSLVILGNINLILMETNSANMNSQTQFDCKDVKLQELYIFI